MSNNKVLIDVMVDGRFSCQLRYDGTPVPQMINGEVVHTYDAADIKRFFTTNGLLSLVKMFRFALRHSRYLKINLKH